MIGPRTYRCAALSHPAIDGMGIGRGNVGVLHMPHKRIHVVRRERLLGIEGRKGINRRARGGRVDVLRLCGRDVGRVVRMGLTSVSGAAQLRGMVSGEPSVASGWRLECQTHHLFESL